VVFSLDQAILTIGGGGGGGVDLIRTYAGGVVLGDAVYQRNDGLIDRADASTLATAGAFLGFVIAIDSPGPGQAEVRFHGDASVFGGLTPGGIYILASSPGQVVLETDTGNINYPDTTPGSGHILREVGVAGTATKMFVEASRDFEEL
jgi:hypothetical protein